MPATLSPCAHIGRRVVIVLKTGIVYGAAGKLTLTAASALELELSLPKGTPIVYLPTNLIKTITPIKEED